MDGNTLLGGFFMGAFLTIIAFAICLPDKVTIRSKTILKPSIELTTDGKTIDTIYIYKQIK